MPKSDLIDFTLFDTNKFYLSNGDPLGVKGLINMYFIFSHNIQNNDVPSDYCGVCFVLGILFSMSQNEQTKTAF